MSARESARTGNTGPPRDRTQTKTEVPPSGRRGQNGGKQKREKACNSGTKAQQANSNIHYPKNLQQPRTRQISPLAFPAASSSQSLDSPSTDKGRAAAGT